MLTGVNHITLAVSDLGQSLEFYLNVLAAKGHVKWETGAYLTIGDTWLCLSLDVPCPKLDYTHIAFDVPEELFDGFCEQVLKYDVEVWKENRSEGASLYLLDPDGHKLEIHSGSLASRLQALKKNPYKGLEWL